MDSIFQPTESLLRAVRPGGMYWKSNGSLSSAAFKDKAGLSVDRTGDRSLNDAVAFIRAHLKGTVVYVTVPECETANVKLFYLPLPDNEFHSEIHRDETRAELTTSQAKRLAAIAHIVPETEGYNVNI